MSGGPNFQSMANKGFVDPNNTLHAGGVGDAFPSFNSLYTQGEVAQGLPTNPGIGDMYAPNQTYTGSPTVLPNLGGGMPEPSKFAPTIAQRVFGTESGFHAPGRLPQFNVEQEKLPPALHPAVATDLVGVPDGSLEAEEMRKRWGPNWRMIINTLGE